MLSTDAIVIGAGQAGLAVSRCLTSAGVEHVVLESGRVGERWRSERWDSLRLLTPNWATRLPGWSYHGPDPDGYLTAAEFADYLGAYAASFTAPVRAATTVTSVERTGSRFTVRTDQGTWRAGSVTIASGWCDQPRIPAIAAGLSPSISQLTPTGYRNPGQLPPGGVLIVGASATGVQLADELARSGRRVILAVGRHRRLPRRYRGRDIWWWLEQIGTFRRTIHDVADPAAARGDGSLQLIGRDGPEVDLPALQRLGVQLAGRLSAVDGHLAEFSDDLEVTTGVADRRMRRILDCIDQHIVHRDLSDPVPGPAPHTVDHRRAVRHVDLRRPWISTVIWATGYTRRYPWLRIPALDSAGEIRQHRGVTPVDGLYVVGQRFQQRRDSDFIDGVRHDAAAVVHCITRAHRDRELPAS